MNSRQTMLAATPQPVVSQTAGFSLQRKCDCGQHTIGGGSCSDCDKNKNTLQRKASYSEPGNNIPAIVHQVLASAGQPLGAATRSLMEPRFGYDFSRVRVHTDHRAAESAARLNAMAYTAGNSVVFGAGRYAPERITGKMLLAHELTHVAQQQSPQAEVPTRVSSPTDASEVEARRLAGRAISGDAVQVGGSHAPATLQLSPLSEEVIGLWPLGVQEVFKVLRSHSPLTMPDPDLEMWLSIYLNPADLWRAHKILEKGSEELWSNADREELSQRQFLDTLAGKQEKEGQSTNKNPDPGPKQHAGNALKPEETKVILEKLNLKTAPVSPVSGKLDSRFFVVHDTAADIEITEMEEQDKGPIPGQGPQKGPLGEGYSVVRRFGDIIQKRKTMFEQYRPTATGWEKAEDKMDAPTRVKLMRQVWAALNPAQRLEAIKFIKGKFGLTAAEIKAEGKVPQDPAAELDPANTCVPAGEKSCVRTMGQWVIERVCTTQSWAAPAAAPGTTADKDLEKKLQDGKSACDQLNVIFKLRAERIPYTTNVEIRQVAKAPFPTPAYTDGQYEGVKTQYLKAALEAGAFPHITTHFWVDRALRGHTDPRCFNMHALFKLISGALNHNPADLYGDEPKYGVKWGEHNVWWGKDCKGDAPK